MIRLGVEGSVCVEADFEMRFYKTCRLSAMVSVDGAVFFQKFESLIAVCFPLVVVVCADVGAEVFEDKLAAPDFRHRNARVVVSRCGVEAVVFGRVERRGMTVAFVRKTKEVVFVGHIGYSEDLARVAVESETEVRNALHHLIRISDIDFPSGGVAAVAANVERAFFVGVNHVIRFNVIFLALNGGEVGVEVNLSACFRQTIGGFAVGKIGACRGLYVVRQGSEHGERTLVTEVRIVLFAVNACVMDAHAVATK